MTRCILAVCVFAALVLASVALVWTGGVIDTVAAPASNHYTENFATTLYRDNLNTTSWWDTLTGELKLFPFQLAIVGNFDTPGNARQVAVAGDLVFVADFESGLRVINIEDPLNPVPIGQFDTPGTANGVTIAGDYAYVADGASGIQVIDITNPMVPLQVGTLDTPGLAQKAAVAGDHLYVADNSSGLHIIDISDPTLPAIVATFDTPSVARSVFVRGDLAYVADFSSGLQIIDISDPTSPVLVGAFNTPGFAFDVVVAGDVAFIADFSQGLQIANVSNPALPVQMGSHLTLGSAQGLFVDGDFVYVADGTRGVQVFDVTDVLVPVHIGGIDTPGNALSIWVAGEHAVVADDVFGMQVIGIADAVHPPVEVARAGTASGNEVVGLEVDGNFAYIAEVSWVQVIDISDPVQPVTVGAFLDALLPTASLDVDGTTLYIGKTFTGGAPGAVIKVFDVSTVTSPTWVGSFVDTLSIRSLRVDGDRLFAGCTGVGLCVFDVSAADSMELIGILPGIADIRAIQVRGDFLLAIDHPFGLRVIDISDVTVPVLLGAYNSPGEAFDIFVAGNLAGIADGAEGLRLVDIGDPSNPVTVGGVDTPGNARAVTVAGDWVFVGDDGGGLHTVDIRNPALPVLVDSAQVTTSKTGVVAVDGNYVFLADSNDVVVFQAFRRLVEIDDNVARSLEIDGLGDDVRRVRLTAVQTDSIAWEISADGGSAWQAIAADGNWNSMVNPGSVLVWRSTHIPLVSQSTVNPTATSIDIRWLYDSPAIDSIVDVPADQGGWVTVHWTRSAHDFLGDTVAALAYGLFRKAPPDTIPSNDWELVGATQAVQAENYSFVVPTLADSTMTNGGFNSEFFVRASTVSILVFDSPPDSGQSIDNLAPGPPTLLSAVYNTGGGNQLEWRRSTEPDLAGYSIYRATGVPNFTPTAQNWVVMTADTMWTDPDFDGFNVYYKITADDSAGNQSVPVAPDQVTAVTHAKTPSHVRLYTAVPNPFNPSTRIRYDVPVGVDRVRLRVFDVRGHLVRTLVDGPRTPGTHNVLWDGRDDRGRRVASGVYFCRLDAAGVSESRKMIRLD